MTRAAIARIRGFASNLAPSADFRTLFSGVSFGRRPPSVDFPRARLASTDPGSLGKEGRRPEQIGLAWDGAFWRPCASPGATNLLRPYQQLGFPGCLRDWQGDFAVALYNERDHSLVLVRDRIGVRPLYYVVNRDWLAFSSQPLALTRLPGVGQQPNPVFLQLYAGCHYRTFDNDPHASPYLHVRQLPAGHWLRWSGGAWEIQRYWGLAEQENFSGSEKELAQEYRSKILQAVGRRLPDARKPGFLLSGGMDSSSVLSAAVHISQQKQQAFSSTYTDGSYDESPEIQTILKSKVSRWSNVRVGEQGIFSTIRQIVKIHEEPVATATWLSHFQVCLQAAKEGIQSLFTGLGGDELNAGEYEHFIFFFADLKRLGKKRLFAKEIQAWQRHHQHPIFKKNWNVAMRVIHERTDEKYPGAVLPDRRLYRRYRHCLHPEAFDLDLFVPILDRIFSEALKNRCYQDIFRETAPCCLRAQDRTGWALGLPHHNPFYDADLVEFMFRIPGTMKIRSGVTKYLLRQAMKGILPEATRTRIKKTGWNAPAHRWFCGKNGEILKDMIRSRSFRAHPLYKISEVDKIIDEHQMIVGQNQTRENHMMFLWQLANLGVWLEFLETKK